MREGERSAIDERGREKCGERESEGDYFCYFRESDFGVRGGTLKDGSRTVKKGVFSGLGVGVMGYLGGEKVDDLQL